MISEQSLPLPLPLPAPSSSKPEPMATDDSPQVAHDAANVVLRQLQTFRIQAVIENRKRHRHAASTELLSVAATTPLGEVLTRMEANDIVAMPVFRWTDPEQKRKEYLGIVSVSDILAFTVFNRVFEHMDVDVEGQSNQFIEWLRLDSDLKSYLATPISELVGKTAESSMTWLMKSSDSVADLIQTFLKFHRVLVLDDDSVVASVISDSGEESNVSCVTMLTRTDLMNWLLDSRDSIAPHEMTTLLNATVDDVCRRVLEGGGAVDDLNQVAVPGQHHQPVVPRQKVVTVPESFTALQGFRVMYLHRLPAIAIVTDGSLVATLSSSDLRGITGDTDSLGSLMLPVYEYLESRKRNVDRVRADQLRVVEKGEKVVTAARMMLESRVHRLWILSGEDRPTGVVSLGDVLRFFVPIEQVVVEY